MISRLEIVVDDFVAAASLDNGQRFDVVYTPRF